MSVVLQEASFEPGALLTAFSAGRTETGAVASFTGLARAEHGSTEILELEAYPGFTERQIGEIARAAQARFDLQDLLIVHRVGEISPGEAIVYPSTMLHEVVPVRSGQRLVSITFIESHVADQHLRAQVYELNEIAALEGLRMNPESRVRLDVVRQNLLRMWSTT